MKLQLKSDFRDYYDHMFDRTGEEFHRYSRTDMHRRDAFDLLSMAGYRVPPHGTAHVLSATLDAHTPAGRTVVAYEDPHAHRGDGKKLSVVSLLPPETYCSLYIPQTKAVSVRELWVGKLWVGLKYQSDDAWRSNVGEVITAITGMSMDIPRPAAFKDYPLIAVDLVQGEDDKGYAVDLNTSPGLDSLRILLSANDVVSYIKEFWNHRNEPQI